MQSTYVRQANINDMDFLADLFDGYRQFYGQPSNIPAAKSFIQQRFEHAQSVIFIAFSGETPVGFTQLYPSFSSVSLKKVFILNDLFVQDSFRNLGIAKQLIDAAKDYASHIGACRLSLSTAKDNLIAQRVYKESGWTYDDKYDVFHLAV